MWRGKGHCRKAGSSLADWPAHCADTRAKRNKIHSHSWLPSIQSWQRKYPSNQLTQSLAKEDHADPCMACSSLEMKPEQQLRSRSSPTSEHQRLRKLPRRGSRGVKFRHGLAPGSEKVSDNDIVFRRYCTNRQEKFWSNLAHKHHHRGARTRRHAGNVALRSEYHAVHKRIKRLGAQLASIEKGACRIKNMRRFRTDPFSFGKTFLSDQAQSRPDFSVEEAMSQFATVYTDDDKSASYSQFEKDPSKPEPSVTIRTSLPPRSLFQAKLKRTRKSSAPGPNRISYLVWKRCPWLQQRLYTVCCKVWQQAQIPTSWRQAIIVLVHKKGDQNNPANFRPVALSKCDSKIFFLLVESVTTTYKRSNNYFDGLSQKGFLPKMSEQKRRR